MERETTTYTTPAGKEVVIKSWLTAGERRKVQEVMIGTETVTSTPELKGDALFKAQDKLVEVAVASYDGSAENILARLLDQKADEYDFVAELAGKVLVPLVAAK
jgi:hypothetical protein